MQVRGKDELTMRVEEVEGEEQLVEKRDWESVNGEYDDDGNTREDDEDSCLDVRISYCLWTHFLSFFPVLSLF